MYNLKRICAATVVWKAASCIAFYDVSTSDLVEYLDLLPKILLFFKIGSLQLVLVSPHPAF